MRVGFVPEGLVWVCLCGWSLEEVHITSMDFTDRPQSQKAGGWCSEGGPWSSCLFDFAPIVMRGLDRSVCFEDGAGGAF